MADQPGEVLPRFVELADDDDGRRLWLCARTLLRLIASTNVEIPEVLLVSLHLRSNEPMGTLWIVAGAEGHFNQEHARVAAKLASFVGIAIRMLQTERRLG